MKQFPMVLQIPMRLLSNHLSSLTLAKFRLVSEAATIQCVSFGDSNKSRAMIGFLTTDNFEPGKIPEPPDTWFKPADFHGDQAREAQADHLDGFDIASIFIRFESGHSNSVSIQHCPFRPDVPTEVPGARHQRKKSSVYSETRPASRGYPWWKKPCPLDCLLSTMNDALRPESDCILIARPGAVPI